MSSFGGRLPPPAGFARAVMLTRDRKPSVDADAALDDVGAEGDFAVRQAKFAA
ncbi:MAG: hypothetical protein U0744_20175 [Gemmataceae bacterium]